MVSSLIVLDETSVLWNPILRKTLAQRGARTVKAVSPNDKLKSTVLLSGEVVLDWGKDGSYDVVSVRHYTPFMVFKGTPGKTIAKELANAGDSATVTANGWITKEAMCEWIHLYLLRKYGEETWLVMDVYPAHTHESVVNSLTTRGVTPFFIPSGLTSIVQMYRDSWRPTFAGWSR